MTKVDFSELIGQHVDLNVEAEASKVEINPDEPKAETKEVTQATTTEVKNKEAEQKKDGKLVKAEEHRAGSVQSEAYKQYIYYGGTVVFILVMFFHVVSQAATIVSFWWLTHWTSHPGEDGRNIGIYALLVGYVFYRSCLFFTISVKLCT